MASSLPLSTSILSSRTNGNNKGVPFTKPISHLSQNIDHKKPNNIVGMVTSQLPARPVYIPDRIPDKSYVRVLDTTLRDGEQAAGVALTGPEKLEIARLLAKLGVDVIEAGFPSSSREEFEAVRQIAIEVGNNVDENGHVPVISGLARCVEKDVEATWEAVKHAKYPRVTMVISTSKIHMQYKLKKSEEDVLSIVRDMADRRFLYQLVEEAIKGGATTIDFADTVGYKFPHEWAQFFQEARESIPGIDNVVLATHCHDDLGLATANTLAAVHAGARQVEVTINGIGERAGNASLEEVVMAIKCRGNDLLGGIYTGINTKHIFTTCKRVEELSGLPIQPNKSIVGRNAFVHASGIHQDGVLKHRGTYEIISPEDIGRPRPSNDGIVLGKLSGRHALQTKLTELGYELDDEKFKYVFWRFKALAEKKKDLCDSDIKSLLLEEKVAKASAKEAHQVHT
ncbi:hypothetical protein Cgig2_012795 [Carnegiea gigantea]|uniref:2-isopropylmalate synthase n=1 Tax=Carnegiea gigantea TaxID=171969 RepID=A0A9Q1KBC6_9CARY|nr:hypothetical protein Cgig2_012795 [Carnegiea gigantea]